MKHFLDACKTPKAKGVHGQVKFKDETIEAIGIPEAIGKDVVIAVRQEENLYQGDISLRNAIFAFLDADGKNADGEDKLEDSAKFLERSPIKKIKKSASSAGGPAASASDAVAAAKSGW